MDVKSKDSMLCEVVAPCYCGDDSKVPQLHTTKSEVLDYVFWNYIVFSLLMGQPRLQQIVANSQKINHTNNFKQLAVTHISVYRKEVAFTVISCKRIMGYHKSGL